MCVGTITGTNTLTFASKITPGSDYGFLQFDFNPNLSCNILYSYYWYDSVNDITLVYVNSGVIGTNLCPKLYLEFYKKQERQDSSN